MRDDLLTYAQRENLIAGLAYRESPPPDDVGVAGVGSGFGFAAALVLVSTLVNSSQRTAGTLLGVWLACSVVIGYAYWVWKSQQHTASLQSIGRQTDLEPIRASDRRGIYIGWLDNEGVDVEQALRWD